MKAHVPTTSQHWQHLHRQARPLNQAEYEEWRNNPVTLQLFNEFEFKTFEALAILADTKPHDDRLLSRQSDAYALNKLVDELFSWAPQGIELEDEE